MSMTSRPSVISASGFLHRQRPFERVERVHAVAHLFRHALDFLRRHAAAERGNEEVVTESCRGRSAPTRLAWSISRMSVRTRSMLRGSGAEIGEDHVVLGLVAVHAERQEQEPWLVDVLAATVDHGDPATAEGRAGARAGWRRGRRRCRRRE